MLFISWCRSGFLLVPFGSAWRSFFNMSYSAVVLVMTSFILCIFEKGFILLVLLKCILSWVFFFPYNKGITLTCIVLMTNQLFPYLCSWYIVWHFFSLTAFKLFSFSLVLSHLMTMCLDVIFFMHIIPRAYWGLQSMGLEFSSNLAYFWHLSSKT